MLIKRLTFRNSPVALIAVAAFGSLLFTLGAGGFLYRSSKNLISAAAWVEHTQEVLGSLQSASLMVERAGFESRLFVLSRDEEHLNAARGSVSALQTMTVHLKNLTADDAPQGANIERLQVCAVDLFGQLDRIEVAKEIPSAQVLRCGQTLGLMTEMERRLLKERSETSTKTSMVAVAGELGFVGISLGAIAVLFSLLLRDAVRRKRIAREAALLNQELAKSVKTLEDRAGESRMLTGARDELQLCVDVSQVYRVATTNMALLLPGSAGSLCMINNSRRLVEVVSEWNEGGSRCEVPEIFATDACCGLRSGRLRWRRTKVSEIQCGHFLHGAPECYLCIPMVAHGETNGILHIECPTGEIETLTEQRIEAVRQLVELTGMAVASLQLRNKLEQQSIRDSMTGLFNRHFMQISLERELALASRRLTGLAVMMLDVDHFKRFNDRFGHAAGDLVLKQVSEVFRNTVRAEDVACRYGGEEFAIILPDTTPETAWERAETIREGVRLIQMGGGANYGELTISIGVAMYPMDGRSPDQLLKIADKALYRAKHAGRDQVMMAEPLELEAMQMAGTS